jgi:hypothetical protein
METTYGAHADMALALDIYQDYSWKTERPVITAAAGLTSAPRTRQAILTDLPAPAGIAPAATAEQKYQQHHKKYG